MERAKVFISSILDVAVEDLRSERMAVHEVVESCPFLEPWAFEKAPASFEPLDMSYLRNVEECDLFVVIVGAEPSDPVAAEIQRAKEHNKPILAFAKKVPRRKPTAQSILDSAGNKYAPFGSADDLRNAVRDAINHALVLGLRSLPSRSGSIQNELREFARKSTRFHIRPTIPHFAEGEEFHIGGINDKTLTIVYHPTSESLDLPLSRAEEILHYGQTPVLVLDGRLQWLTRAQRWRFFPDKPHPSDLLGLSKQATGTDLRFHEIGSELKKRGFALVLPNEVSALSMQGPDFQVVYDNDGQYFKVIDRPHNLVLVAKRGQ